MAELQPIVGASMDQRMMPG